MSRNTKALTPPAGMVILGRSGEFETGGRPFHGAAILHDDPRDVWEESEWKGEWKGTGKGLTYAAPIDSEIARLNGKTERDVSDRKHEAVRCVYVGVPGRVIPVDDEPLDMVMADDFFAVTAERDELAKSITTPEALRIEMLREALAENERLREALEAVLEELESFAAQHYCGCKHPYKAKEVRAKDHLFKAVVSFFR